MTQNLNCPCCEEPMVKIGTEVKIIDNFHDHVGYVEDSIVKIIEHDDYGNYILSSGHCCSESEIEIIKTINMTQKNVREIKDNAISILDSAYSGILNLVRSDDDHETINLIQPILDKIDEIQNEIKEL